MTSYRSFQTNFTAGEVDPLMSARVDTAAFRNGARRLRNVAMLATGGVTRRWGTRFTGSRLPARARLAKWEFSAAERYVVAFAPGVALFFDMTGGFIARLEGCPWNTEAIIAGLRFDQAADTMIVAHRSFMPQVIRRTGLNSFALATFTFADDTTGKRVFQPYYKFADDKTTLTPSGAEGSIELTTNGPVFVGGHVGARFRWHGVEIVITEVQNSTKAIGTVKGKLEGKYDIDPFKTTKDSKVVEVTHVAHGFVTGSSVVISGANATGGISAAALNGTRVITVIDQNTYSFEAAADPDETANPNPGLGGGAGADYAYDPGGDGGGSGGSSDSGGPEGGGGGPE